MLDKGRSVSAFNLLWDCHMWFSCNALQYHYIQISIAYTVLCSLKRGKTRLDDKEVVIIIRLTERAVWETKFSSVKLSVRMLHSLPYALRKCIYVYSRCDEYLLCSMNWNKCRAANVCLPRFHWKCWIEKLKDNGKRTLMGKRFAGRNEW